MMKLTTQILVVALLVAVASFANGVVNAQELEANPARQRWALPEEAQSEAGFESDNMEEGDDDEFDIGDLTQHGRHLGRRRRRKRNIFWPGHGRGRGRGRSSSSSSKSKSSKSKSSRRMKRMRRRTRCPFPTTVTPVTSPPTTSSPTTVPPTTVAPTTAAPATEAPITSPPTAASATVAPTTASPTLPAGSPTASPTTAAPTTGAPTTGTPTTGTPTTTAPTPPTTTIAQCTDNPQSFNLNLDIQVQFPDDEFAACDSAAQDASINANIQEALNSNFATTVADWQGTATFGEVVLDIDQEVNNVDPFGFRGRSLLLLRGSTLRLLQEGTCPTRTVDCSEDVADYCRWGCVPVATTDCGNPSSPTASWVNLAQDIQARLAGLGFDCLGIADELRVVVTEPTVVV